MKHTFTESQLVHLIRFSVFRYEEYIKEYGRDSDEPLNFTTADIISSLQSELELFVRGEVSKPSSPRIEM